MDMRSKSHQPEGYKSGHRQMNFYFGIATRNTYHNYAVLQELCSSIIFHLSKMRATLRSTLRSQHVKRQQKNDVEGPS